MEGRRRNFLFDTLFALCAALCSFLLLFSLLARFLLVEFLLEERERERMSSGSGGASGGGSSAGGGTRRRRVQKNPNAHLINPGGLNLLQVHDAARRQFIRLIKAFQSTRQVTHKGCKRKTGLLRSACPHQQGKVQPTKECPTSFFLFFSACVFCVCLIRSLFVGCRGWPHL